MFFYVIFIDKSLYLSIIESQLKSTDQYLLSHLFMANHYIMFSIIHTGYMVWFIRYGNEMIEYLQSPIFTARFGCTKMIAILVLSLVISIMILTSNLIISTLRQSSSIEFFNPAATSSLFIFQNYEIVSWLLLILHQWKISRALNQIHNEHNSTNSMITIKRLQRTFKAIKKLSNFNDSIRQRFSWLLIVQLLDMMSYLIGDISYMISLGLDTLFGTIATLPLRLLLWLKLCQMNRTILEQFDRIEHQLCQQLEEFHLINRNRLNENKVNKIIKMKQMYRFRHSFGLWIFQNYNVNFTVLLHLSCFVIGYITLMYQTD